MLRELLVRNFGILGDVSLAFGEGLNVVTGETGAGKSVILEALGVVLGDRASRDRVRSGADEAVVELVLDLDDPDQLDQLGIPAADELIVRRHISAEGRSRIYLSGTLCTVQNLRDVLGGVVDVHGQFENQSLLSEARQMELLDRAGGYGDDVTRLENLFREWKAAEEELARFRENQRDLSQRADLLRYQVEEITEANVLPGEDEHLEGERARLAHAERLIGAAAEATTLLRGEPGGAIDALHRVLAAFERIREVDRGTGEAAVSLRDAIAVVEETADYIRDYGEGLDHTPGRLDEVMSRLDCIDRLKKKYGATIEDVVAHGERVRNELDDLADPDRLDRRLETAATDARTAYDNLAAGVREARRDAGADFGGRVEAALRDLAMPAARFSIDLEETPPTARGTERARFLFSANPGEEERSLAKIASGGELSRVMLAIKSVLGDATPVLVFDEVDAGIGGQAALAVADRLRMLAGDHQVICVTHQAAVAAKGHHHLRIQKEPANEKTLVSVETVTGRGRVEELARMLGGSTTAASRKHAQELLETA